MQQLIEEAASTTDLPDGFLGQMKTILRFDRHISAEVEDAIEKYSTAVCRKVADDMRDKLPRELYDMVYWCPVHEQVCVRKDRRCRPELHTPVFDDSGNEKPMASHISPSPRTKDYCVCPEHFWRDEALGLGVARELMESIYRQPQFFLSSTSHSLFFNNARLSFLLNNDRFRLGLQPNKLVSKSLCQLHVDIGLGEKYEIVLKNQEDIIDAAKESFAFGTILTFISSLY
jgi:hypothetical protein